MILIGISGNPLLARTDINFTNGLTFSGDSASQEYAL